MDALDRFFGLSAAGTDVRTEVVGGVTTYLTMAYILFVQPSFLWLTLTRPVRGS